MSVILGLNACPSMSDINRLGARWNLAWVLPKSAKPDTTRTFYNLGNVMVVLSCLLSSAIAISDKRRWAEWLIKTFSDRRVFLDLSPRPRDDKSGLIVAIKIFIIMPLFGLINTCFFGLIDASNMDLALLNYGLFFADFGLIAACLKLRFGLITATLFWLITLTLKIKVFGNKEKKPMYYKNKMYFVNVKC